MIDPKTRSEFSDLHERAMVEGTSFLELLDRYHLLATEDQRKEVQRWTAEYLILGLEGLQPTQIAALGGNQTVTGAVNGCIQYIKMYIKILEKK